MTHVSAFFLALIFFFAISNPLLSHGQAVRDPVIGGVSTSGNVCCTSTGNCPGKPLSGASVNLICRESLDGPIIRLGQNTTDINGLYNITIGSELGAKLSQAGLCNITVTPPLDRTICPPLSAIKGVITAVAKPTGSQLTERFGLTIYIIIIEAGPFTITVIAIIFDK